MFVIKLYLSTLWILTTFLQGEYDCSSCYHYLSSLYTLLYIGRCSVLHTTPLSTDDVSHLPSHPIHLSHRPSLQSFPRFPKPHRTIKNHYILSSNSPSKQAYNILLHRACNLQGFKTLQTALENTPFLPQEGPLLAPWRACSQTEKGVFCQVKEYILRTWGAKKVDKGKGG